PLGPVDLLQRESSLRPSRLPFEFGGGAGGVELLRIRLVEEGVEIEAAAYADAMVEAVAGEREGEGIGQGGRHPVEGEVTAQVQPLHQLHHEVGASLVDAGIEDADDVGMLELRERLELAGEPRRLRGGEAARVQELERYLLVGAIVLRPVDDAGAASAERAFDPVRPNDRG